LDVLEDSAEIFSLDGLARKEAEPIPKGQRDRGLAKATTTHHRLDVRAPASVSYLRTLATALESYRRTYGKLPDTLEPLGPAPQGGISPEAANLVDAELSTGKRAGYTIRYRIVPASGNLTDEEANQTAKFELAATPVEYGKDGRRSFYLDSDRVLRGADKQGAVATSTDPRIGSS